MSRTRSPATGRSYGLARVARIWRVSRATIYRHRSHAPSPVPRRPGPVGPGSDADLVEHIGQQILASRFHGEGSRKIWARLRHAGICTSARREERTAFLGSWARTGCWRRIGSGGPAPGRTTARSSPRR